MSKYNIGFPKIRWEKGIPRILIDDTLKNRTQCAIRGFAIFGVLISVTSFPWQIALAISALFFFLNILFEKVIFYYFNQINFQTLSVPYDSSKWIMNGFTWQETIAISPEDDEFSIVFNDLEYARAFFDLLRSWNEATELKLSFIIDEDIYFVYLYPDHDVEMVNQEIERLRKDNLDAKLANEAIAEINHLTICKSFPVGDFYLGHFLEHHPENIPCKITAYFSDGRSEPQIIESIEAVTIKGFKARIPSELTMDEYEGAHWQYVVQHHRKSLGALA